MAYGAKLDELVYVGMVGILDPPRPGVREAIRLLQGSGVSVKMLTGDAQETACAIGKSRSLLHNCSVLATSLFFSIASGFICARQSGDVWRGA